MHRVLLLATGVALTGATPAAALVGSELARLPAPTDIAARDGVVAYTSPAATGGHAIVIREGRGTRTVGVPPQERPFTLALGTGPSPTEPALVYPRCTGMTPNACRLAVTPLASDVEKTVPGTRGAVLGALSGTTVAAGVRRGDGQLRIVVNRRATRTLRVPRRWYSEDDGSPRRQIDPASIEMTDIDVRGDTLAYVLTFGVPTGPFARSELWAQRIGRSPRRLASIGTGGASSGRREFLGIRLQRTAVVAYRQGRDQGNALVRLSLRTGRPLSGVDLGQGVTIDVVSGAYDAGRFLYVTREHTGRNEGCATVASDGGDVLAPGVCTLRDSGSLRFTRPRTTPR